MKFIISNIYMYDTFCHGWVWDFKTFIIINVK